MTDGLATGDPRAAEEIAPSVLEIWELASGDLIIDAQGLALVRLGHSGVMWHTRRISWDGFQNVHLEVDLLVGEAWSPIENRWLPISVDLESGRVDGGSYKGPEMNFDYLQPG